MPIGAINRISRRDKDHKRALRLLPVEQDIRNVLWLESDFHRSLRERLSGEPEGGEVPQIKVRVTIQGVHVVDKKLVRLHSHETTLSEERRQPAESYRP
jgi:hypothetical protein